MSTMKVTSINVHHHGVLRGLQRAGGSRKGIEKRMIAGVIDALVAGRQSLEKPCWAMRPHEKRKQPHQSVRYLWDKDEQLVWVVGLASHEANVITVLCRLR